MKARLLLLLMGSLFSPAATSRGEIFVDEADLALARPRATDFSCVVLLGGLQSGSWNVFGSAVAFPSPKVPNGSQWVLCAAHEVAPGSFNGTYEGLRVTVKEPGGYTVLERGYVDKVIIHPNCSPSLTAGQGVDLALLHISNALTRLTPAVIYDEPLPPVVLMYQCGYGLYGVAGTWPGSFDGAKRAGCNIMGDISSIWIESQYLMCSFDPPGLYDSQSGEWQLSGFDSGGGGFVNTNGQMRFAATLCLAGPNGNYNFYSRSGVLPIAPYLDWIYATIAAVEQPKLTLRTIDGALLKLSWPSVASEFLLQTQETLANTNWATADLTASDDGTNRSVILTNVGPSRFWRLAKPPGPASAGLTIYGPTSMAQPAPKVGAGPVWNDLLPHVPVLER
jgi:hypothetical protein